MTEKFSFDELWYRYLTGEWRVTPPWYLNNKLFIGLNKLFGWLPSNPHCLECGIPMAGVGGMMLRFRGSSPSSFSPKLCSGCERSVRKREGGAELVLSMLFADVRGSTPLAEATPTSVYMSLIQRFYKQTSDVLIAHNAMVNRLMGDQVSALFVPRFAGKQHARVAIHAASELLRVTGHGEPGGPWVPVGVGVHTGEAYVGAVGSGDGVNEITVLGTAANLTARLSSLADTGEILISSESARLAGLDGEGLEQRSLVLKGIRDKVSVVVMKL